MQSKYKSYYDTKDNVQAYINKDVAWSGAIRCTLMDLFKDLPVKGHVLDAGCGYGRDVDTMRSLGYNAFGVDQSAEMINAATKLYGDYFKQLSLQNLGEWQQKYDILYSRNVLVHVIESDLPNILQSMVNVIKPNGVILIVSKEGNGISISNTTGKERETILHNKEYIAELLQNMGMQLLEPPSTLPLLFANSDKLFTIRARIL